MLATPQLVYQNPVYPKYFADPFVWKHDGKYYAVGTGPLGTVQDIVTELDMTNREIRGEQCAIPLLSSDDMSRWKFLGGALRVKPQLLGGAFWAPEVAYDGEYFYLYYSTATIGLLHQLRVAKSKTPEGPFEDVGLLIGATDECPFAIDAHPFQDDDGQWYLFYARDFLDVTDKIRAGTALVVDKLVGMTQLAGAEKTVLRARNDWQIFKRQREMYGHIWDWHTLEGPFVQKHDGRYYCFYSGGCYENDTYGVDYGVADHILGPYTDEGNETGPRVMKSMPGKVIGPGHNSIVKGPDDETDFLVYHAWDTEMKARRMCIDKLEWTDKGPRCAGPTWTTQELTLQPGIVAAA
ncbi:MAG: glycoside hydrolase family protein [Verrucomicrobiales bacterium]|nr:glycoside hydrolase family protein [Verrucomicrobiales bacterium]